MANKKFYYRKKQTAKSKTQNAQEEALLEKYSSEQLSKPIEILHLSVAVTELFAKNNVLTIKDVVSKTEKDLYRIQGFNKKMLLEVKCALSAQDMSLSEDVKAAVPAQNKSQKPVKADREDEPRPSRFGLADRPAKAKSEPQKKSDTRKEQSQKQPRDNRNSERERNVGPLKKEDWHKIMKGGKWGYSDGVKVVITPQYDDIFAFKENLASVEQDEKCGYINENNEVVIPLEYDMAMSFSEGLALVMKREKCGYIDKENNVVIPFEYDAGTPFENGEAKVKKDGKWATVTKDGQLTWI